MDGLEPTGKTVSKPCHSLSSGKALPRFTGAVIDITMEEEGQAFGGTMVQSYCRDEAEQVCVIEVSPQLLKLCRPGHTDIDGKNASSWECKPGEVAAWCLQQPRYGPLLICW